MGHKLKTKAMVFRTRNRLSALDLNTKFNMNGFNIDMLEPCPI